MGCTCVGLLSLIIAVAAVVFSAVAAGLPLWSTLKQTVTSEYASSTFTAGVWGYCSDVSISAIGAKLDTSLSAAASSTTGQCYLYYTANNKIHINLNNDENNTVVLPAQGVCATYSDDGGSNAHLYATVNTIDQATFDAYLNQACGIKGKLSLAFSMLSPTFGVFGTLMLALGVCCSKNRSCLVAFALIMTAIAGGFALGACIVWSQEQPSGTTLTYGISYYLEIAALVSYAIAVFFLGVHMTQGHKHDKDQSSANKVPIKLQEALEKHKKNAAGRQPTRLV
ncbi:hypothetical protein LEN26_016955 [Aphanomyces euteiches]|nr:hypothetical protein LEN26_016955 [Aphanomyces euteiches]KAH9108850.1 hypothetical protein AeMF1_015998 [Aphanomyces euteiches]KAH9195672.1 hypothetical protein AeNC1_002349 [Aphanomyces euteiches]